VGRLGDRRKGAPFLFEAYRELLERNVPVTLDVVGELGRATPPPALPGLRYHGPVDAERLSELYRECDVFVAPSTGQESFGIVLLEAMASGKPVVCSDIEGYRSVAATDGARLVPPRDVRALRDALEQMVAMGAERRRAWGESNRRVAERYDWTRIVERVREEYRAAIVMRGSLA
jgi:phosphatidylinositol alpha-mannosyltransferase